ncbi:hypothetical protein HUJ05_001266, partial [Dendroctonus ponderosae]
MQYSVKRFILLSIFLFDVIIATDYCKICKKGTHTLCRYKEGPSDGCTEYKKPEFTTSVKKYIIDVHNDIRNHIASGQEIRGPLGRQPAAANMNSLQWHHELAEIAQRWADQCVAVEDKNQHDECRKTEQYEVGQNVLTALTATPDVPEIAILILNWYKQVENVLPSDVETFSGIQRGKYLIGQYTQLVWADTRFVGCGMATFRNRNTSSDWKSKYLHRLVCNYGPRGNMIGSPVYKRGIPCSKCPYGRCDSVRTNLCSGLEQPNNYGKFGPGRPAPSVNPTHRVDTPISLFNTLSLQYIFANNLTQVINGILQKIDVSLGPKQNSIDSSASKIQNINELLSVLASIIPDLNLSEAGNEEHSAYSNRIPLESINRPFLRSAFKKTSNILYQPETFISKQTYELENGQIIVEDCKNHIGDCQFEDEKQPVISQPSGDIVLPNNMIYRKAQ